MPEPRSTDLCTITPVILAGGAGKRLWPLSTAVRPKPFLRWPGGRSFLQLTAERVSALSPPFVVCNARHRALAMQQVPQADQLILEPQGRGTAPALAAAAHYLARQEEALLLALPSDHMIARPDDFLDALAATVPLAKDGWLVTFGIEPVRPSPHFGYIRGGPALSGGAQEVGAFVEKPDKAAARSFIESGNAYWNSGIFLFSAKAFLATLQTLQPEIFRASYTALARATRLQNSIFLNEDAFSACPALSIDYAVMEKSPRCAVKAVSMGWRDLGTWPSLMAGLLKQE